MCILICMHLERGLCYRSRRPVYVALWFLPGPTSATTRLLVLPRLAILYHSYAQRRRRTSLVREAAERIVRERLDGGEGRVGTSGSTLASPQSGEKQLGRFYFEDKK